MVPRRPQKITPAVGPLIEFITLRADGIDDSVHANDQFRYYPLGHNTQSDNENTESSANNSNSGETGGAKANNPANANVSSSTTNAW